MSDETPQEDRTEEATSRKRESFRERGQVAKSKELASAAMLGASALAITSLSSLTTGSTSRLAVTSFSRLDDYENFLDAPLLFLSSALADVVLSMLPGLAILALVAIAAHLAQTGPMWSWKQFEFKPEKFNPISGMKRIFMSKDTVINLLRELLKVVLLGGVIAVTLKSIASHAPGLVQKDMLTFCRYLLKAAMMPLMACTGVMVVLGVLDFLWQRHRMEQKMKMSKDELKREMKQSEGDPMIAARRKAKHREMVQINKMIGEVATASVVINNPTHISVALRYRPEDGAPVVVAKGEDQIALRIREMASEHRIPMVTNIPLARAMHASCALNQIIPETFFKAVAEILARLWSTQPHARPR